MRRQQESYQYRPSRRRRSNGFFRLNDLPTEIRLLVIELSFPTVNDVSRHWPAPIPALLMTSKQLNVDTKSVMKNWSPIHYVPDPSYLRSIPHPGAVRVENVCLSMFDQARIGVLRSGPNTSTPGDDHQDLVVAWTKRIHSLPQFETIKTITIDATPAPSWLRYEKPTWLPSLLNDKSVADRFIYEHIEVITDLIATITGYYSSLNLDRVNVELAGLYGQRSRFFPEYIQQRALRMDLHVPFTGSIVSETTPRHPPTTIRRAIGELYSPQAVSSEDLYPSEKSALAGDKRRLLSYTYSATTEFLFTNCCLDNRYWTMQQLEHVTGLALDDEFDTRRHHRRRHIDISIPDFAAGSFVCSLAKDLLLFTSPRNSWKRREIRVYCDRYAGNNTRTRRANQSGFSFSNLLITGAAVVLFLGLVRYEERRMRR